MKSTFRALLAIHCAVFLFGLAGLFGKLLAVSPALIVFGRTLFAGMALLSSLFLRRAGVVLHRWQDTLAFLAMGAILAVHWVTFFHAIQISTVAVGLLAFSSFPVFVTFLEPLFFKERIRPADIGVAIVVCAGLILVVPQFDLENEVMLGVLWGTVSGLTFAVLSIFNRKFAMRYSPRVVAFYQNISASVLLLPWAIEPALEATAADWVKLVVLGVVFTALAHSLFIKGMQTARAQLASVIACLEPAYGILFAALWLREVPSLRELVGGIVIVGAIAYASKNVATTA